MFEASNTYIFVTQGQYSGHSTGKHDCVISKKNSIRSGKENARPRSTPFTFILVARRPSYRPKGIASQTPRSA